MAGLYLHIPFCKQACHYCDFHFSTTLKRKDDMIQAMMTELRLRKNELGDAPVSTIYFGGGTPSLLTAQELDQLLNQIYTHYSVDTAPEITLEANPDDLSVSTLKAFKASGINRLSIGVQSFFAPELLMMNRAHTELEAHTAVADAMKIIDNVSIDLIYGIPGLSDERWAQNIQLAADLGVQHLSSYALTVEPKTALAAYIKSGKYPPVEEDLAAGHFDILVREAEKNGFIPYEISNFGKPGYFSKHNTAYWQGISYLGIGPSAHSYHGVERSWNVANNAKYIKALQTGDLPSTTEALSTNDQMNELIMTGLRTVWGVDLTQMERTFGASAKAILLASAQKMMRDELLIETDGALKTTAKGKFLCDGIAAELFFVTP